MLYFAYTKQKEGTKIMNPLQTIDVNDAAKISKAIRTGEPFYISDRGEKVLAYDPEIENAKKRLADLLKEAEDCKNYITLDECRERLRKV